MRLLQLVLCLAALCSLAGAAAAQCAGIWLPSNGKSDSNGLMAALPSGDVLVAGILPSTSAAAAHGIARYTPATDAWSSLGSGFRGTAGTSFTQVTAIAAASNGDIFAGGAFDQVDGVIAPRFARRSAATGSWSAIDPWRIHNPRAMLALPGGDLIAAGEVYDYLPSQPTHVIARWSAATNTWSDIGALNQYGEVYTLVQMLNGDILVGGRFASIGGVAATNLARWSPASSTWTAFDPPLFDSVNALAIAPSGDIIAGGNPPTTGPTNALARWSATTHTWVAVGGATTSGGGVGSIALAPNGDIWIAGTFTRIGTLTVNGSARWNAAASAWQALSSDPQFGVNAFLALPSGDLLAIGAIPSTQSPYRSSMAILRSGETAWRPLHGGGLTARVRCLAPTAPGQLVAGGDFTTADGLPANRIALKDLASNAWTPLGAGVNGNVDAVAVPSDGAIVAGGAFTTAGGSPAANIARWTPATQSWSPLGAGVNGEVLALATDGADVIAGGTFTAAGGQPAASIARWSSTPGAWSPLGAGLNGAVNAVLRLPSGDILAAGAFTASGSTPLASIARFNPATSQWLPLGSGLNGAAYALATLPSGDIAVGGHFTSAGGVPVSGVARWNPTTGAWSAIYAGAGIDTIRALAVLPSGDLILGGSLLLSSPSSTYIARWHASTGLLSRLGSGTSAQVLALAAVSENDLAVGGEFTTAGTFTAPYFARYVSDGPLWVVTPPQSTLFAYNDIGGAGLSLAPGYFDVSYQWYRNGVPLTDGFGAASPGGGRVRGSSGFIPDTSVSTSGAVNLAIDFIRPSDAGSYHVVITSACGAITSVPVSVTVRCPGDYNADGAIDITDIFNFLTAWFRGDLRANYTHSGHADVTDIFDFLARWFAPC